MISSENKVIKAHDFSRGDTIERAHLQAIKRLLDGFARTTSQKFTSSLHHHCVFEIKQLDQLPWRELIEEFETGMYFFTFSMHPLPGRAVLAMPTEEALALVDLRLAGPGDDDFSGRVPSEIDQAFLAPIVEDLLGELRLAFARLYSTSPVLETQEANVLFVSIGSRSEACLAIRMSFSVAERDVREAVICLPIQMVRMLVESLKSKTSLIDEAQKETLADLNKRITEVPLQVVFQFPSILTTPAELLTLRVGDTMGLGHAKGRPLEVRAEGVLVALADICSSGVHKAFEIVEEVTK